MRGDGPRSVNGIIRAVAPLIHTVAARRGAAVVLDLRADTDLEAAHVAEALQVALLVLAEHAAADGTLTVRAADREGGDAEVVVGGLDLPPAFPEGATHRDLWHEASEFLQSHHRTRFAHADDRVLLLVPHGDRADRLRGRVHRSESR